MYWTFSTQKLQTLRCVRFGFPSLGGILFLLLLERDLVGIDVPRHVLGHPRQVVDRPGVGDDTGAGAGSTRLEELDVVGDHLGGPPLLAVLAFPGAGLQPALDVDQRALAQEVRHLLGEVPLADVPGHDVVVVGELLALPVGSRRVAVGGDRKGGDRLAARRVAHLRVLGQAAHQHHLVQACHHASSASSEPSESALSATGSPSGSAVSSAAVAVVASDAPSASISGSISGGGATFSVTAPGFSTGLRTIR